MGAAQLRSAAKIRSEITVLKCEQKAYPIWLLCRRKSHPVQVDSLKTVFCSVEKHAGQEAASSRKNCNEETRDVALCFSLLRFFNAFQQNWAQSILYYLPVYDE